MDDNVLFKKDNHVAYVILNRVKRGNSITIDMINQFVKIFDDIDKDDKIRSVVITGNGKFFCTGMDLSTKSQDQIEESLKDGINYNYRNLFNDFNH